jgi:hypothetical protein
MALVSPGVQVTVIDESFYTPAEPGTTPLIVVATAENKTNAAGTGTASATTQANAGVAYRLTSQKDLVDLFGVPFFEKTASGSPIHGSERNEYGLLAAYSLLGVTNSVFMVRADINLNELEGVTTAPGSEPSDGQWWVDTRSTAWGIQEWNSAPASVTGGQKFSAKTPIVLTDADSTKISNSGAPLASVGVIGDYAVVFETGSEGTESKESAKIYYKSAGGGIGTTLVAAGDWVLVGSPNWVASHPTVSGTVTVSSLTVGDRFILNGTTITVPSGATVSAQLTSLVGEINQLSSSDGISARQISGRLYLYSDGSTSGAGDSTLSGAIVVAAGTGTVLTNLGISAGTYLQPKLTQAPHTQVPTYKRLDNSSTVQGYPTGSVWLKTTEPNSGARWRVSRWNSATASWVVNNAPLYASGHAALFNLDRTGGGVNLPADTLFVQYNSTEDFSYAAPDTNGDTRDITLGEAQFRVWRRATTERTSITSDVLSSIVNGTAYSFTIKESVPGQVALSPAVTVSFTGLSSVPLNGNAIAGAINAAGLLNVEASFDENSGKITIVHKKAGDIRFTDGANNPIGTMFGAGFNPYTKTGTANFYALKAGPMPGQLGPVPGALEDYLASSWKPLASEGFIAAGTTPLNEAQDGQLWYNPAFGEVDIMVHNGNTWVGYKDVTSPYYNAVTGEQTDPAGPIVSASEPTVQSDGTGLKNGDLWISTADLENFPTIYRWDSLAIEWVLLDKSDQTTEDGVLFADARYGLSGATGDVKATIPDLLTSNYLDPDAPDPDLYPRGMLLWNLRRSGGNVKRFVNNYINTSEDNPRQPNIQGVGEPMEGYATDRWVTASANNEDGSGSFGRKAQRKVVVAAMKSVIDTSEQIRDEERRNFNIIAAPGYPEVLSNLINLNIDRGLTAFVIGDTPLRLRSDATTLVNWGTNANLVFDNGDDGIVSFDEYAAVYYPNGFTTDLSGNNAVVPASHMMLRTIALSDQVSYPWFAPAGTRRGGITNATAVGYIDASTGEFQTVALNEGTRDVLYDLKVNPIPFFVGVGHVAFGQKTRGRNASALDRINVARLVVYLRSQLNKLARPYIFEPNDKITRDEIKGAVESLLLELVGLRAIFDFAVVCDESNNTPSRIDRNELYVDIAIEPVKAVEFIYIPLRVKNTGEI